MAAIDETAAVQDEPVEFLTAEDLQGITGQLDQLLSGQSSICLLYTSPSPRDP